MSSHTGDSSSRPAPVTMRDIARDLNVSVITVSKVLRNHPDIGSATRERVLKRVRELNFRPNPAARSLATQRSFMIGVVVPDLIISFFAELILGVSKKLRARGYEVVVANSEENAQLEMDEVDRLVGRRVDGLIIASSQPFGSPSLFRELASRNVPFLLVDRDFPDIGANFVGCDNEQIGQLATRHLVEAGCLRIAHLRGPETATGVGRDSGYRRVLQEAGLAYRPELVVSAGSSDTSGYSAMQKLLAGHASPDGVFGYNDLVAAGALKAILEGGLKVPENVAIIGAGNHRLSNLLLVPLSTIDQKAATMGVKAAELMLKLIEPGRAPKNRRITIPAELVIRQSTRVSRRPVRINQ